ALRLRAAELGDKRLGCRIGLRVQLALEQRNEVFVPLERFGLASRGGERLQEQPMRVLTQTVDRNGPARRFECLFVVSGLKLLLPERYHGVHRQRFDSLAFNLQPLAPGVFPDVHVGQQTAVVKPVGLGEGRPAALTNQTLQPSPVASDQAGCQRDRFPDANERIRPQSMAQSEQRLAQVLARLDLEMRAPKQSYELVPRLRRRLGQSKVREQAGELLARQIDRSIRPGQRKGAQQGQSESRRPQGIHSRPAPFKALSASIYIFHAIGTLE